MTLKSGMNKLVTIFLPLFVFQRALLNRSVEKVKQLTLSRDGIF